MFLISFADYFNIKYIVINLEYLLVHPYFLELYPSITLATFTVYATTTKSYF